MIFEMRLEVVWIKLKLGERMLYSTHLCKLHQAAYWKEKEQQYLMPGVYSVPQLSLSFRCILRNTGSTELTVRSHRWSFPAMWLLVITLNFKKKLFMDATKGTWLHLRCVCVCVSAGIRYWLHPFLDSCVCAWTVCERVWCLTGEAPAGWRWASVSTGERDLNSNEDCDVRCPIWLSMDFDSFPSCSLW